MILLIIIGKSGQKHQIKKQDKHFSSYLDFYSFIFQK